MSDTFLKTSDTETANKLRQLGYKEIKSNGGIFTFINDPKVGTYAQNIDTNKIVYSNKMTF